MTAADQRLDGSATAGLLQPFDRDVHAELVVAACCAASRQGAQLAHDRLAVDDFTVPELAAVFAAAIHLTAHPAPTDAAATAWVVADLAGEHPAPIWPSELRRRELSAATGITVGDLERLEQARPVMADVAGSYARRVKTASERRRLRSDVVWLAHTLDADPDGLTGEAVALAERINRRLQEAS